MYSYPWCHCRTCVAETGVLDVVVARNCAESGSERNFQSLKCMGQWEWVGRYELCVEQTEMYQHTEPHLEGSKYC